MGGFVAAVPRNGIASPELIERVIAASRDRAPDGVRHVVTAEGVVLVQCMFANTPESVGEVLPKCDRSGRVWIVKRGHLNDIEGLRGRLRDRLGPNAPLHTDADVMLAAYLAWGPDMAGRIHGEFTLAIWDGRNRSLFVLRDHLGLRGCYVHDGDEWYVAASEPAQVLVFPGVSDALDEMGVVDYLSGWMVDRVRTFWEGVRRPTPATSVVARGRDVRQRMYWMPTLCADKATKGPEHYAPAVRWAFEAAVRSALRSPTPVVCDLSGGLDSSAIVGMAAKLRAEDPTGFPEVFAHSMLFPGFECDESEYIAAVVDKWRLPWVGFDAMQPGPPDDPEPWIRSLRLPCGPSSLGSQQQVEWMQRHGCRVRISGDGGDEVFRTAPLPLERGVRPRGELWPYFWWSSRRSVRKMARRIRRELVRPRLPRPVLDAYLRVVGAPDEPDRCLTDRARALRNRLLAEQPQLGARQTMLLDELWNCGNLYAVGGSDGGALRLGYETRCPFLDVRVVDLLGVQPLLVHRWHGTWRALQTHALADLYPERVASRRSKADVTDVYLMMDQSSRLAHSDLLEIGLVDRGACEAALASAVDGAIAGRSPSWSAVASRELANWRSVDQRA